ncbi:MAG TPA: hypothetical protein VNX70_01985 [Bryobacteraceae bacterium]|jgi:hypothetical protein|nr:hypothetical protein [Bryobacteraceae bacterium]
MFLQQDTPKSAAAAGGVYAYKDWRAAPDTINVLLEYPSEESCGTEGRLPIDRHHYKSHPAVKGALPVVVKVEDPDMVFAHVSNFLVCCRTHLGNVAYMEKHRIDFDPQREEILPF